MKQDVRIVLRRVWVAIPTIIAILVLNFFLIRLAPGDAADVLAGQGGSVTPEYLDHIRSQFGLDRPMAVQLGLYLLNVAKLDLGYSFHHNQPVLELILDRLPATLLLVLTSIVVAVISGIALGTLAARYVNTPIDSAISVLALLVYATPSFWLGLMLIVLFSVVLGWLPTSGMQTVGVELGAIERLLDVARHLLLPAFALASFYVATYTRLVRASMLEIFGQDFVRTAVAKGAGESRVTIRHVLRNALIPLTSMVGVQTASLLGGSVLIEAVFGWPGLGRLTFEAVFQRDYNLLLGVLLLSSILVVVINTMLDLVYARLDPRIEVS